MSERVCAITVHPIPRFETLLMCYKQAKPRGNRSDHRNYISNIRQYFGLQCRWGICVIKLMSGGGVVGLSELRRQAKRLSSQLKRNEDKQPFYVEFAGTPKAGKSTCIDIVSHFFRRTDWNVLAPAEGASKRTPLFLKEDWIAFNAWSACYALQHILEGVYSSEPYHMVVLDRGLFDALAWFEYLRINGALAKEDCRRIHEFLLLNEWRQRIETVFLFYTDPQTSLERENEHTLIDDPGSAMNLDVISDLNQAYERIKSQYADTFGGIVRIDTSGGQDTSPRSTAKEVVCRILERMEDSHAR